MVNFYYKKVVTIEKQLDLAKIGYREEVLKLSSQMARTSREESDNIMQQINEYADAIMALEESLKNTRNLFLKAKKTEEKKLEVKHEDNE